MATPKLSIVILNHNEGAVTGECLKALSPLVDNSTAEVILVDNGSANDEGHLLAEQFPWVTMIYNAENRGVAPARNQGLAIARGSYALILDNDTLPVPEAILAVLEYLESHPNVGVAACLLADSHGSLHNCRQYPGIKQKISNLLHPARKEFNPEGKAILTAPQDFDYLMGAFQMFPMDLYRRLGPLDESIFYGPEDCDWCLKVMAAGKDVVCLTSHQIIHYWQRSTNRRLFSRLSWLHAKGLLHFYSTHNRWF